MEKLEKKIPRNLNECFNIDDIEKLAITKLSKHSLAYYYGGSGDEITLRRNRNIFNKIKLYPKVLVNVSETDTSIIIQNRKLAMPIFFAPAAMHRLACPSGEKDSAKAAFEMNTLYCLSTHSSCTPSEVAAANKNGLRWYQLYLNKNRDISKKVILKLEELGYSAIVLTVDAPVAGYRERDHRARIGEEELSDSASIIANFGFFKNIQDSSFEWEIIDWLKSITKLEIYIKGIHRVDDALIAREKGVKGIFVGNHGGRQLDTVPSALEMLIPIAKACKDFKDFDIFLDGGIRRGVDVFKALAFGAKAVFIGRPLLWGLACGGEQGVKRVFEILMSEFITCMKLCGVNKLEEINESYIFKEKLPKF